MATVKPPISPPSTASHAPRGELEVDPCQQFYHRKPVMRGNSLEKASKRAGFDGGVRRDGLVVLAVQVGRDSDMRAPLPGDLIAEDSQCLHELLRIDVPR